MQHVPVEEPAPEISDEDEEEEVPAEVIEIDGVKYAPVVSEEDEEEVEEDTPLEDRRSRRSYKNYLQKRR